MAVEDLPVDPTIREAIRRFVEEARDRYGDKVGEVILYGSVARGEATEGSDVDLLVRWDGTEGEAVRALIAITTRILVEAGILISLHPVSPQRFRRLRETGSHFYRTVQREGIRVTG